MLAKISKPKSSATATRDVYVAPPPTGSFVLFSKDNRVNSVSPLGYYALAKFKNDSKVKSEMFATACEVFISSK